jgi:hypothetical protein
MPSLPKPKGVAPKIVFVDLMAGNTGRNPLPREPNAISNARFYSRSHKAVIRVYDVAGNVIETHEHAGGFSITNYSELFSGAGLVISLLNGGAALTGKSGRKTPNACDVSARETNIDAAAQSGHRMRLDSSGGQTCPDYSGY